MSTTPKKEDEKETLYIYVADYEAKHPLNPERTQLRARAVTEKGAEKAEFFGKTVGQVKAEVSAYHWGADYRLAWVDAPDDHPKLRKLLDAEDTERERIEGEEDENLGPRGERWERGDLALLRSQHHICNGCDRREICAIASHPAFDPNLITVAGCMSYRPDPTQEEEDDEDSENGLHRPFKTT